MMTVRKLRAFQDEMLSEDPFSRVALDEVSDPAHIRKQLELELTKHLRAKEGIDKLAERIQSVAGVNANRAKTIARTEKTRAQSVGRMKAILDPYFAAYDKAVKNHRKRPPYPWWEWVEPMRAKQPRHDHISLSGRKVPVGEEFGFGLRCPGDPNAPIKQTANCHCYTRRVNMEGR